MPTDSTHIYRLDDADALSGQTVVHDEYGIRYVLVTPPWKMNGLTDAVPLLPLAEGGQGAVYLTENPNVVLKFAKKDGKFITEEAQIEEYRRRIRYISTLPLPPNSNVTMPETFTKGYAGYRMVFLDGMCSIKDFFMSRKQPDDEQLSYPVDNERLRNYLLTGGLAHRLAVFGKTAIILARLHVRGISYGDISQSNIFLPRNPSESETWLIDPDNMVEEGNPHWSQIIGTDPYYTPEFCDNQCCTVATDTFSFAELAFELLSDRHPFHGAAYGNSDLFADEKYDPRLFAWICDPGDKTNRADLFLAAERLLSPELMKLFWQTFVAGKEDPECRSPMSLWPSCFFKELDDLVYCPQCRMNFLPPDGDKAVSCPLCKSAIPGCVLFTVYSIDGEHVLWQVRKHITADDTASGSIQERAIAPFEFDGYDQEVLFYSLDKDRMAFQNLREGSCRFVFYPAEGKPQEIGGERVQLPWDKLQSGCFVSEARRSGMTVSRKIICRLVGRRIRK